MKLIDILNQSYKDKSIDEALTKKGSTVDDQDKQSRIRYDLLVNMDDFIDNVINDFNGFIKELKTISKVEGYVIKTAFYMNSPKETKAYPDHLEDIDLSLEDLLATTISVQFKVLKKADKSPIVNFSQEVGPFNANINSQKTRNLISKNLENMINKTIHKNKQ
jgi:hypothetical protein